MSATTSTISALVRSIVNDGAWDAVNGLIDELLEQGRSREAVLLRRRMRQWQWQREDALDPASGFAYPQEQAEYVDGLFRDYVRERFPNVRVEDVPMWLIEGKVSHAVAESKDYVLTACRSMIFGAGRLCKKRSENVCRKCRLALATMTLLPKE